MPKQRLDMLLVERDLCPSRQLAQRWIRAGEVKVNETLIDKPGTTVDVDAEIVIKARSRFVSRGGEKLAEALTAFAIDPCGRVCLDAGISTGGFTDCLLQNGAALVYGVDVGYGQVAWSLQTDDRVIIRERTNIRHLQPEELYTDDRARPDFGVADVSFISVTKIYPALHRLLHSPREMVVLVKPQFEVGKARIGKNGVVRDPVAKVDAIAGAIVAAQDLGWRVRGLTGSPITGPAGNTEFLLWLSEAGDGLELDSVAIRAIVDQVDCDRAGR
jgi:23S rRNA (cytidine1920-2'-O)/16S rRNA (cytidine1409-2'-O)-methyltransferase